MIFMRTVYLCNDTITDIYSALYQAWLYNRDGDTGIEFHNYTSPQLFTDYVVVEKNHQQALKLEDFIKKNLGMQSYGDIYYALLANDPYKAEAVFKAMQESRKIANSKKIMEHLTNPAVATVAQLSKRVGNEAHLYSGFVRFRELENGIMFAEISPNNQILTCIGDYFAERFPEENWMIYDKTHNSYLVHQKQQKWIIIAGLDIDHKQFDNVTVEEDECARLWQLFHTTISIKERENPKLQQGNLPVRFRGNMLEFRI